MNSDRTDLLNVLKKIEQLIEESRKKKKKKWEETCDSYFEGRMDAFDFAWSILADALKEEST